MTRRADAVETRARELAIAAGVDPEIRVPKSGSERGMPAWCTFRDTAHAELNTREAKQAAAQIVNLRLQEPSSIHGRTDGQATAAKARRTQRQAGGAAQARGCRLARQSAQAQGSGAGAGKAEAGVSGVRTGT
jgi:hypothetical protein